MATGRCLHVRGGAYYVEIDKQDEQFFRVVYPNFWAVENDVERSKVREAALYATAKTKVAKVCPVGDDPLATVEMSALRPRCSGTSFSDL